MKRKLSRALVLDWESSGLPSLDQQLDYRSGPQGIEVAAIVTDTESWTPLGEFRSRIRFLGPPMTWSDQAFQIHRIAPGMLIDCPEPHRVAELLIGFLGRFFSPGSPILLAAYNPRVDRYFLNQLFVLAGHETCPVRFHSRMLDAFSLGFFLWGAESSDELYRIVNTQTRYSHNAFDDADMVVRAFRKATESISGAASVVQGPK